MVRIFRLGLVAFPLCNHGLGPNRFDTVTSLENWVEKGIAPGQMIGTGTVAAEPSKTMTRPLCAFPNVARYKGTGDANDASNFQCVAPK